MTKEEMKIAVYDKQMEIAKLNGEIKLLVEDLKRTHIALQIKEKQRQLELVTEDVKRMHKEINEK